jgi:hypothetical protein
MTKKKIAIAFFTFLALSILGSILFVLPAQPSDDIQEVDEEIAEDYQKGYKEGYETGKKDGMLNLTIRTGYFPRVDLSNDYYRGYDDGYKEGYLEANPGQLRRTSHQAICCCLPCMTCCFLGGFPIITCGIFFSSFWSIAANCMPPTIFITLAECTCPICWPTLLMDLLRICSSFICLCFQFTCIFSCGTWLCSSSWAGSLCMAVFGDLLECESLWEMRCLSRILSIYESCGICLVQI